MIEEQGVQRFSTSVPPELLRRFDETIKRIGYDDRSKAIRDAMQNLITESKWVCEKMGRGIGAVVIVYDHETKDIDEAVTDVQHRYGHITKSSLHIHLNKNDCMEIIAVDGDAWDVRELAHELRTKKGVKQLKLAIVTP